jgi:type IV pilus assembly protein PilC
MPDFVYTARDAQGQLVSGTVAAAALEEAGEMLYAQGKFVVSLAAGRAGSGSGSGAGARRGLGGLGSISIGTGIKRNEVIFFTNQMAVMVGTGVPLIEGMEGMSQQATNPAFRKVLEAVVADIRAGQSFSDALARHPKVFPVIMTALIRAGEASGTMPAMLERTAKYLTKEHQTLKQAKGAMMYPAFMFFMCVSVTTFLLTAVLPRFAAIYDNRKAVLPLPTRILIGMSQALIGYWPLWLGLIAISTVGLWIWMHTPVGKAQIDWIKLHAPVFGTITHKLYLSRATRTLGTMVGSGLPLLECVGIVRGVTRNVYYERFWDDAQENIRRGRQLSECVFASRLIPAAVAQMIQSGERAGRLSQVFERIADFSEAELDQAIKSGTQFIEPVMIVVMGSIIGSIAIALLLPIFSIGRVIANG